MTAPLNRDNEKCNKCGRDTESLGGRSRICYHCEKDGLPVHNDDEFGFEMRDPTPREKKKLDLDILELDFDIDFEKTDPGLD